MTISTQPKQAISLEQATALVNEISATGAAIEAKKAAIEQWLEKLQPIYGAGMAIVVACTAVTIGTVIYRAMK